MDVPALILRAQAVLHVNQSGLAKRLQRGQSTVSRWESGDANPDFESCLRLALITGLPAAEVLRSAGHDPSLLPTIEMANLNPIERDVLQRAARVQALAEATEGVPEDFIETYVRKVLDRTEDELTSILRMLRRERSHTSPVTTTDAGTVTGSSETRNEGDNGDQGRLTVRKQWLEDVAALWDPALRHITAGVSV